MRQQECLGPEALCGDEELAIAERARYGGAEALSDRAYLILSQDQGLYPRND